MAQSCFSAGLPSRSFRSTCPVQIRWQLSRTNFSFALSINTVTTLSGFRSTNRASVSTSSSTCVSVVRGWKNYSWSYITRKRSISLFLLLGIRSHGDYLGTLLSDARPGGASAHSAHPNLRPTIRVSWLGLRARVGDRSPSRSDDFPDWNRNKSLESRSSPLTVTRSFVDHRSRWKDVY